MFRLCLKIFFSETVGQYKTKVKRGVTCGSRVICDYSAGPATPGISETILLETCPPATPTPLSLLSMLLFGVVVSALTSTVLEYPGGRRYFYNIVAGGQSAEQIGAACASESHRPPRRLRFQEFHPVPTLIWVPLLEYNCTVAPASGVSPASYVPLLFTSTNTRSPSSTR